MAINTSTNKVRIISTTVSGLSTNSKFSDIKSPALVVNTSEGGIFYADGTGGTSLKQLAALPSHTHSGYATTTSLANYLPLAGGTLSGDLSILYGDTDKFVMWDYDGDGGAGASWRIGAKGTGSSNTNYFTIQSGTSTTTATTWTDVLNIGQNDFIVYFTQTPKVGSTSVSLEGHTHSNYYNASTSRTKNTVLAAPNGTDGAATFRALVAADLPVVTAAKGGSGKTTLKDSANAYLNALDTGSADPVDADYYIAQYAGGGTTTTTYHRRPVSALFNYIKGKLNSTYLPLSGGALSGYLSSSDYILGTGLIRVNASGSTSNFGYIKAETYDSNRSVVHIGSNYGGSSSISNSVSYDAIGIYRTCVGIGGTFTYATLKSNYDNSIKLDVSGNVKATKFIGDVSGNATTATTATTASKVTVGTGTGSSYRAIVVTNGENGLYTAGTAAGKPQYNYSTGDVKAYSFTTDGGNFVGNLTGTASGNLALSGGTMTGRIKMSSTTYPQIYGNGTYLAFGYDSGASQVVIDSSCIRRGSSATVSLGSSTYPWSNLYSAGGTLTGALTISGTSATTSTINFTRDGYSYISSKGVFAIEPKGLASSGTTGYQFDASAFYPGVTNTYTIGTSSLKWKNVYATTFTGNLSGNASTATKASYANAIRDPDYYAYENRRTSANINFNADGALHYFLASSSITDGSATEGHILHFEWDNAAGKYLAQLNVKHGTGGILRRYTGATANSWSSWIQILDASNYTTYCASVGHTHSGYSTTDTKNTAGSSNKKTKIFVVGAASQNSTGVTTYSDVSVYITDGKLYASNFITSSDERIKTNIKEVKNSVDSLGLRFVEFDYKDSSNHSAGHIAQEVKEVLPEFVHEDTTNETQMLSIDYTGLHSVQIKALLDRIIKLEEEIKILKSSK